jgi:hypothetical protein
MVVKWIDKTKISDRGKNNTIISNQDAKGKIPWRWRKNSRLIRIIIIVILMNVLKKPLTLSKFMNPYRMLIMIIGFQNIMHIPVSV